MLMSTRPTIAGLLTQQRMIKNVSYGMNLIHKKHQKTILTVVSKTTITAAIPMVMILAGAK